MHHMNRMIKKEFIKMSVKKFIKGTFILTLTGIITRLLGFFFKIFLSRIIGAENVGLYQLIMPVSAIGYAIGISGFEVAISKLTAIYFAKKQPQKAYFTTILTLIFSLAISITCTATISINSNFIAVHIFDAPGCAKLLRILS